ncbi:MAG: dihydroorotase, partial [Pseudomonadota bacterium]
MQLTITQPDDFHLHLRDGTLMGHVVSASANQFARAIIMPNLSPPVIKTADALAYQNRIQNQLPPDHPFKPLMTLFLCAQIDADDLVHGFQQSIISAVKLYPSGVTTNSAAGPKALTSLSHIFATMERHDIPLLIHGEVPDHDCDIFDREARFIDRELTWLTANFPALRIVFEHITTIEALHFVDDAGAKVAATITPHHLMINRS